MQDRYMPNIADNRQLYNKSYLIEFYGTGGTPEEAFTFSTPPESEDLTYSQRKVETKTFGGVQVDDYGADAVRISLSGSTINQELKPIFRGDKEKKWLSGEAEIYYLRDLINQYKTGTDNIKKKIMIYDLSKFSTYAGANGKKISNYWVAFPGDFKIRRSNDRPFTYKYTFDFTGIPPENQNIAGGILPSITLESLGKLQEMITALLGAIEFIDGIMQKINTALEYVDKVRKLVTTLSDVINYASEALKSTLVSTSRSIASLIKGFVSLTEAAKTIIKLPEEISLQILNIGKELVLSTKILVNSVSEIRNECSRVFSEDGYTVPLEVQKKFDLNSNEFKDTIFDKINNIENIANQSLAFAKSGEIPEISLGYSAASQSTMIIISYGYFNVNISSTDTFETLANKYFGNPDKALEIALYNGISSIDEIPYGKNIRLPILTRTQKSAQNLIFSANDKRDNYGSDILLNDEGYIVCSSTGDYALTVSSQNLLQAVLLRLKENVSKRIRLNTYGIRTNLSEPSAAVAYILASIDATIKSDPRVSSVDDIKFKSNGDRLYIDVFYSDINGKRGGASGAV